MPKNGNFGKIFEFESQHLKNCKRFKKPMSHFLIILLEAFCENLSSIAWTFFVIESRFFRRVQKRESLKLCFFGSTNQNIQDPNLQIPPKWQSRWGKSVAPGFVTRSTKLLELWPKNKNFQNSPLFEKWCENWQKSEFFEIFRFSTIQVV